MSDLKDSWEDDPAAQDDNLARQTQQQMNLGQGGGFRPGAANFQPTAQTFQPGGYGGSGFVPQYQQQQQQYYGGQGYYPQYGGQQQQQAFGQYGQQGYGAVYGQGQPAYNQGYGGLFDNYPAKQNESLL